jgi:hypothetical protein
MQRNLVKSQLAQEDDFDKPFLWLGKFEMEPCSLDKMFHVGDAPWRAELAEVADEKCYSTGE